MTQTQYTELVNTVKAHDYHYFIENCPQITDEEYDRLYFQLQDYEQQHPEQVLPDSPTQCAHAEVKNGHKQIKRRTPMLSTEKAQTVEKVEKWMKATTKKLSNLSTLTSNLSPLTSNLSPLTSNLLYTVEWKYDGISCSLVYQDGKLIEASYGKGIEGNDCLELCKQVASIPNEISAQGRVEVRGEMVVPFANLQRTGYKNCRSAASGIMADTATTMADCLYFIAYWSDCDSNSHYESIEKLENMGFGVRVCRLAEGEPGVNIAIQRMTERRDRNEFPTDGLVIKVEDKTVWDSLGATEHHPKYAIAYKFAAATAETTITRIEITTGATGKRTPVAYFEPVCINGATYQKASVGSEAKLQELGLQVGSKVVVSLRNDVIPHIDGLSPLTSNLSPLTSNLSPLTSNLSPLTSPTFIGTSESGENSGVEEPETKYKAKRFAKIAGKVFAGAVAIAGIACVAYCAVGLVFFLPLLLRSR